MRRAQGARDRTSRACILEADASRAERGPIDPASRQPAGHRKAAPTAGGPERVAYIPLPAEKAGEALADWYTARAACARVEGGAGRLPGAHVRQGFRLGPAPSSAAPDLRRALPLPLAGAPAPQPIDGHQLAATGAFRPALAKAAAKARSARAAGATKPKRARISRVPRRADLVPPAGGQQRRRRPKAARVRLLGRLLGRSVGHRQVVEEAVP